ncbi:MAG: hypothetical protein QXI37_03305 [Thermoprotei archaeon]
MSESADDEDLNEEEIREIEASLRDYAEGRFKRGSIGLLKDLRRQA